MAQRGNVFLTATDPAVHFTEALVQNAIAIENVPLVTAIAAGLHSRSILRHLVIFSLQQLAWEVALFGRRGFHTAPIERLSFLGSWRFTATDGKQYGASPYIYQAQNIDLPYADYDFEDSSLPTDQRGGMLHLLLVNRSPTAKADGAAGAIRILTYMEPTYGF